MLVDVVVVVVVTGVLHHHSPASQSPSIILHPPSSHSILLLSSSPPPPAPSIHALTLLREISDTMPPQHATTNRRGPTLATSMIGRTCASETSRTRTPCLRSQTTTSLAIAYLGGQSRVERSICQYRTSHTRVQNVAYASTVQCQYRTLRSEGHSMANSKGHSGIFVPALVAGQ